MTPEALLTAKKSMHLAETRVVPMMVEAIKGWDEANGPVPVRYAGIERQRDQRSGEGSLLRMSGFLATWCEQQGDAPEHVTVELLRGYLDVFARYLWDPLGFPEDLKFQLRAEPARSAAEVLRGPDHLRSRWQRIRRAVDRELGA